jgi:hypothetical protein
VEFSQALRHGVLSGDITVSIRLWKSPRVHPGRRYRVGVGLIEIDAIEPIRFDEVTREDVRRSGERDLEALRARAAHAGPIDADTLVFRVAFHTVGSDEQ